MKMLDTNSVSLAGGFTIRIADHEDFSGIWPILREVIRHGNTYPYDAAMTLDEGRVLWMDTPEATVVAEADEAIVGSYVLRRNQPGRGGHVANAAYLVDPRSRGQGIGRALCLHSLHLAKQLGFRSMQFNLVVSTNVTAIHLWTSCGFQTLCTVPQAFFHAEHGYVDALIMHRQLDSSEDLHAG